MSGLEIGIFSVLAILVLIYSGLYVPVALGLVSFIGVWLLRGTLDPLEGASAYSRKVEKTRDID